jgi:putative FmdB family regulatory protein
LQGVFSLNEENTMPIYDFRCAECGMEFEVSRPRSAAGEPAMCPLDGKEAQRIFSSMGFVVKGDPSFSPMPTQSGGAGGSGVGHSHGPFGHSHGPGTHTH